MTQPTHALLQLSDKSQLTLATDLLTSSDFTTVQVAQGAIQKDIQADARQTITIARFVDGRGLSCPQPLLQSKMALRKTSKGEFIYMVATDPNSQADMQAYAKHNNINLYHWQSSDNLADKLTDSNIIIFHFLIQS